MKAAAKAENVATEEEEEAVTATLRKALGFFSTLQAHDGHWPAEAVAAPLFFLPPLVMTLHITGALNTILTYQHQKEIIRYIYNHQVPISSPLRLNHLNNRREKEQEKCI